MHFKILISNIHFKIAPSKKAFQNCCLSSIVIEGIRTLLFIYLFFSQKKSKKKKNTNLTFKQTKNI